MKIKMNKAWYDKPIKSKGWQCPECKEILPSGIVGIANHWADCGGKGFHEALVKAKEKDKLTFEKYLELKLRHDDNFSQWLREELRKDGYGSDIKIEYIDPWENKSY